MKKIFVTLCFAASLASVKADAKPTIIAYSQHRRVELNDAKIAYVQLHAPLSVKQVLENYSKGGTIRNNEAADMIIYLCDEMDREARIKPNCLDGLPL